MRVTASFFLTIAFFGVACGQSPMSPPPEPSVEPLTLERALQLAKAQNGDIQAAILDLEAARAQTRSARGAFYPTVTPSFSRRTSTSTRYTGPSSGNFDSTVDDARLSANWRLWDSGERKFNLRRSELGRDATEFGALETLRNTLFGVHQRYYDTLRAYQLLAVRNAQLDRATRVLEQTQARLQEGAIRELDVFQAEADQLNARADVLGAENQVDTSEADLKSILGWPSAIELPPLVDQDTTPSPEIAYTLEQALEMGIDNRPGLRATRKRVEAQEASIALARINNGVQYSVDASFDRSFAEDVFEQSLLIFQTEFPLYNGGRTEEDLRAQRFNLDSLQTALVQSEREARAEIEATYKRYAQNYLRLQASEAALVAAQRNFDAVSRAADPSIGAVDLVEVVVAQATLATAESNRVEAFYDTLISEVQLLLVTGQPLPGQEESVGDIEMEPNPLDPADEEND
ncbi:MAG: TolC family protein [Fimbriimonadaceae bacterium]